MKLSRLMEIDDNLAFVHGNKEQEIRTISNIEYQSDNALVFLGSKKYIEKFLSIESSKELTLLIEAKVLDKADESVKAELQKRSSLIVSSSNFPLSLSRNSKPFYDEIFDEINIQVDGRKLGTAKIHPSAILSENIFIGDNVTIGEDVVIMPGVTILPSSSIEAGTVIYPNVTCYSHTRIGKNCRIHSGTVIGADGFGYNYDNGVHHKVWHFGGVIIEDDVEIGSNVSIDQGTFSPTILSRGSKLDNQVQIAHNVFVGPGAIICGQAGLAGSSKTGAFCVFGGKSGLADGKEIGNAVQVAGNAMVVSDFEDGAKVAGHPARPLSEWMKGLAFVRKNSLKK